MVRENNGLDAEAPFATAPSGVKSDGALERGWECGGLESRQVSAIADLS